MLTPVSNTGNIMSNIHNSYGFKIHKIIFFYRAVQVIWLPLPVYFWLHVSGIYVHLLMCLTDQAGVVPGRHQQPPECGRSA